MNTRLTKKETTALWHAVDCLDTLVRIWREDARYDATDPAYVKDTERLKLARSALRKVNKLRKQGL